MTSILDALNITDTRDEKQTRQIETVTNWVFLRDWCDKITSGTMRNVPVIVAVIKRPATSAIKIVFWYDHP